LAHESKLHGGKCRKIVSKSEHAGPMWARLIGNDFTISIEQPIL
jgi:hypothetical protein